MATLKLLQQIHEQSDLHAAAEERALDEMEKNIILTYKKLIQVYQGDRDEAIEIVYNRLKNIDLKMVR